MSAAPSVEEEMRRTVKRMMLALLVGCGAKSDGDGLSAGSGSDSGDVTETGDPADTGEYFDAVAELKGLLVGHYDSSAQAAEDPGFYNILLTMCPVDFPELGSEVLYVEQTAADTPDDPYRQRLYVLEPGATESQAVSRIFEMSGPGQMVGTCDSPAEFALELDRIRELEGCGVVLDWNGTGFEGGTIEDHCVTDWNGADYATSEITLYTEVLVSWDRGWASDGTYVWGATEGGYQFVRQSALGEW